MQDPLQRGRQSFERRAWLDAYQALRVADQEEPLAVDDLDRLATSAYLVGRELEFVQYLERLHRIHLDAGAPQRAARYAFWLGLTLLFRGQAAQSNAWIARGRRLIDGIDCVEAGFLLLPLVEQQLHEGDVQAAHATATEAAAVGSRFGDADLIAIARHLQGRALIAAGSVVDGLALLDESMLSVVAGELSLLLTGLMYCSVIAACRQVYALGRAREWTFALSSWCEQQSQELTFTGTCLVHRAEIMQFHGAWPDALAEARSACERSDRASLRPPAAALYQQAEIHRLRGEFDRAEEAYRAASHSGFDPQPGLALLRLCQGRTDAAAAAIGRLFGATTDPRRRARLLPARIEIALAIGEVAEAREAWHELDGLAQSFDSDVLRATTLQAGGAIELSDGSARTALVQLRQAFEEWGRLDVPYECARVRLLIGLACHSLGDSETAALEFSAARSVFEQLEAKPDLERMDRLKSRALASEKRQLTRRECEVLRLIAAGHTNRAIAATLSVSERTVDRHVSNILVKLGVPSRAAATAYAYSHNLL